MTDWAILTISVRTKTKKDILSLKQQSELPWDLLIKQLMGQSTGSEEMKRVIRIRARSYGKAKQP